MTIELRELRTAAELAALPELEMRIWGSDREMVSVNVLVATISEGGMAIGAFEDGALVGAVYGFATRDPHVLHSHYLAVDVAHRGRGLGAQLKHAQRDWCLARGITKMRWTYDPLQLGNAHLNLHTLGAVGISYHVDHYGTLGGINGSLPSDRVTVRWDLDAPSPSPRVAAIEEIVDVPYASPADIAAGNEHAWQARAVVREALAPRLGDGWLLVDVDVAERHYRLAPNDDR